MLSSIRLTARMESITNTLVALVALVIAGGIFFGFLSSYFLARIRPPTPIDASTLDAGLEKPLYFASVTGDTYDTGYYWTHEILGRRSSWIMDDDHFGLLDLGGRYLMIYTPYPINESRVNWVGTVYPMPSDIEQEILTPLTTDWPQISGLVYPYFLNVVEAEEGFGYWLGLVPCVLLAAFAVYWLVAVIIVTVNPKRHDIFRDLARFGAPLDKVAEKIEADFRQGVVKIGAFEFGNVFFVRRSSVAFQTMLYRDVVWAYLQVTEANSRYGKTVTSEMHFLDKYGKRMKWAAEEKDAQQILQLIRQRAPWAYRGNDPEYARMWARERQQMIAKVDQHRAGQRQEREARRLEPQPDFSEISPVIRR